MYVYNKIASYVKAEIKKLIFVLIYNIDLSATYTIQLFDIYKISL